MYIFVSAKAAEIALSYFSNLKLASSLKDENFIAVSPNGTVSYQLCYQCNNYQAKFPAFRVQKSDGLLTNTVSRSFGPNFYSDNLCRKVNSSHEKKKKYAKDLKRAKIQEEYSSYYSSPDFTSLSRSPKSPVHMDLNLMSGHGIYVENNNQNKNNCNINTELKFSIAPNAVIPLNLPNNSVINVATKLDDDASSTSTSTTQSQEKSLLKPNSQLQLINFIDDETLKSMRSNSILFTNYDSLINDIDINSKSTRSSSLFSFSLSNSSSLLTKRKSIGLMDDDHDNIFATKKFCADNLLYN